MTQKIIMVLIIVSIALLINVLPGINAELPSYFLPCNRSISNYTECLKESIKFTVDKLKNGDADADIPPLEPFVIQQVTHDLTVLTFKVNFIIKELVLSDLTNFEINNITVSGNNYTFDLEFPELKMKGRFLFSFKWGKKVFDNIVGSGKGIITNLTAHCVLKGKPIRVNKKDSLEFDDLDMKLTAEESNVIIQVKDHQPLEKLLNMGLNGSKGKRNNIIYEATRDDLKNICETKLLSIIKEMTFGYPMEELHPI